MDDDKKIKIVIAIVIISMIFFAYRIVGIVLLGKNMTKFKDEFFDVYAPLNLEQYFDNNNNPINTKDLQSLLLDNEIFNTMMEGFEPIENNSYKNSTAVLFYNVIYCTTKNSIVSQTTDEEKELYSGEYNTATYKIKRKDFNKALKELTGITMNEVPNMEELQDFVKYDKKKDTYYLLEANELFIDGSDRTFNIRMLESITKDNDGIYTISMFKYDMFKIYSNVVTNSKVLVNEARVGDYRSFYEKCLEKDKSVPWEKEVVKVRELIDGVYTKYEIIDKQVYSYTMYDINEPDLIYPIIKEKIDDNTYKVNLNNSIVELIDKAEYLNVIIDENEDIIVKSENNYSDDIGKEVGIRGRFVVNGEKIEFVEEALDWMKDDFQLPTIDWDSITF